VVRRKDGNRRVVDAKLTLIRASDGSPHAVLAVKTDITERLEMEDRLHQSQRLEAVGQLTGGIAHDFNNLLTVILGNAEMLTDDLGEANPLRPIAEMMVSAAERGAALTNQLLAFSRRQALAPKTVDVNRLLTGLGEMIRRTLGEHIEIQLLTGSSLSSARIDPLQLENAVLNLCINARDAMPNGGQLTIETTDVELDAEYAQAESEVVAGHYVMIAVSDVGTGMAPETLARAFEPFFTTKEVGCGSGLGLSMVFGFMKQSGGHVKIYSELGFGTMVKMYLPSERRTKHASGPTVRALQAALRGGMERLLLVEDNNLVRQHAASQLRQLGYGIVEAADAVEALHALQEEGDFDLLFTDVVMPGGMNGPQLAAEAKRMRPDLRVLYSSGYTEGASGLRGLLEPGVELLQKPYRRKELAEAIRRALDGAG
jgi:signal transduction histidine kinase/CheY-like chemotaxis protein